MSSSPPAESEPRMGSTNGTADDRHHSQSDIYPLTIIPVARPQILTHNTSQRSVSAEEYGPPSARSTHRRPDSSDSNEGLLGTEPRRYSTPPQSPSLPPVRQHERYDSTDTNDDYLPSGEEAAAAAAAAQATADESEPLERPRSSVRFDGVSSPIRRKPVASSSSRYSTSTGPRLSQMSYDISPPTPGVDDSQYIRFAIDQLTRDEEVRQESRAYPSVVAAAGASSAQNQAEQAREAPTLTPPAPAYQRDSGARTQYEYTSSSQRTTPSAFGQEDSRGAARAAAIPTDIIPVGAAASQQPPAIPPRGLTPIQTDRIPPAVVGGPRLPRGQPDVFVPFDQGGSPLNFLPQTLKPWWLALYLCLLLLMLAGLLFSGIWSGTHLGFWRYTQFGGGRYFVFQYLPTMAGTFLLMWLFQIQIAAGRIAPFIAMASISAKSRTEGPLMEYMPTQFLLPRIQYFRAGQPVLGACMLIFWLQIFTVPLLTVLYNVYFYGNPQTGEWRWNASQVVTWVLFGLYLLQALAIAVLIVWVSRQRTGLKWDPRSIADIVALLDRSNIMSHYAGSETFETAKMFRSRLGDRSDRLGYWQTSKRPNDSFYGIGEEGGATRRYTLEAGLIREKGPTERSSFPDTPATAEAPLEDLESGDTYAVIRYRYLPWYLRPSYLLLWCIAAILLYVAFLIVSYINRAVIRGFAPLTPVTPSPAGYSATNFVYSFVPAVISWLLFICWLSIDYAFRRLAPYQHLSSSAHGASASSTLLLDYPFLLPVSVTFKSLLHGDLLVLWFSSMSIVAAALPVLAGGCFWAQFYIPEQQVRVAVEPAGFYALNVFLALYAFSLPLAFIGLRKRRLPHEVTTLAEVISFLYQSRVLGERQWRAPTGSKSEISVRLRTAVTDREKEGPGEGRFVFGKFTGRDGRTHLGIERLGRGDARVPLHERTLRDSGFETGPPTPGGAVAATTAGEKEGTVNDVPAASIPFESSTPQQDPLSTQSTRQAPATGGTRWLRMPVIGTPFREKMEHAGGLAGATVAQEHERSEAALPADGGASSAISRGPATMGKGISSLPPAAAVAAGAPMQRDWAVQPRTMMTTTFADGPEITDGMRQIGEMRQLRAVHEEPSEEETTSRRHVGAGGDRENSPHELYVPPRTLTTERSGSFSSAREHL